MGRLAEDVSIERAQAVVSAVTARLGPLEADRFRPLRLELLPLRGWGPPDALRSMLPQIAFSWALTILVLLVACANVANLLLARAVTRRREIGIRLAIGAGRGRLVRQLLAEALLLSLAAGAVGTLVAFYGASWFQPRFRGPLAPLDVAPDATTLAFTLAVALVTGVLFGLVPAWRAARPDILPALAGESAGVFRRSRLQGVLVAVQVALSVALLFTGGLFVRRLQAMGEVDVGYDAERVVAAAFDLYAQQYSNEAMAAFYEELRARVARLPGVVSASVPAYAPLGGGAVLWGIHAAPGEAAAETGAGRPIAFGVSVAPDYFRTLGIPLVRGRDFEPADFAAGAAAVVVSESLARRLWPGRDAIGRRFRTGRDGPVVEVAGVARDIAASTVLEESRALVYVPYTRHFGLPRVTLLVRTAGDPAAVMPALRHEVRQMDAALPLFDVQTLAEAVDREIGVQRRLAALVAGFGALALLLAPLGLYGVVAYTVAGRTREIGLRIALGARSSNLVGLFVRDGLRLTAIGLAAGGLLAAGLGRVVASTVVGVRPLDPTAALGVLATLALAAALASYLAARRAARVDPMRALRVQ